METNPEDVTPAYAEWAAHRGVRVSLGVQSFDARVRDALGRRAAADPAEAFGCLRAAGVANVGIDLIFGVPGQGKVDLECELAQVARLQPDHVSWYELDAPQGTALAACLAAGAAELPDDDQRAALFRLIVRGLGRLGYRWYEVSNFALPGRRCRHNSAVWRGEDYLGLGPAAVSTLGDLRRQNLPDLAAYLDSLAPVGGTGTRAPGEAAAGVRAPVGGTWPGEEAAGARAPGGGTRPGDGPTPAGVSGEKAAGARAPVGGTWPGDGPTPARSPVGGTCPDASSRPAPPPRATEYLGAAVRARERLILAARTSAAVPLAALGDYLDGAALPALTKAGFVREAGGTLWVTRKGRHVANAVCVRLFRDSFEKGTIDQLEQPPKMSSSPEVTT